MFEIKSADLVVLVASAPVKISSLLILVTAFAAGCGGASAEPATPAADHHAPAAAPPPHGAPRKPIGEAAVGDRTKCPVSGEEFVVSAESPKVEHEGKTYYFCCAGCDQKFRADPQKYLAKPSI